MDQEGRHVLTRRLESGGDPATDVKAFVHDGRLIINVKGQEVDNVELPPTADTSDARATYQCGVLRVDMACKDPSAPAMLEKAALDPDRPHPGELPLEVEGTGHDTLVGVPLQEDPTGRGAPPPAKAEFGADEDWGPSVGAATPVAQTTIPAAAVNPKDFTFHHNPLAAMSTSNSTPSTLIQTPEHGVTWPHRVAHPTTATPPPSQPLPTTHTSNPTPITTASTALRPTAAATPTTTSAPSFPPTATNPAPPSPPPLPTTSAGKPD